MTTPETNVVPTVSPATAVAAETTKNSGWAIASFVCGLTGCLMVPSILAVIFGIMGIRQINRSAGRLKGMWMAVTGLVLGGLFGLLIVPGMLIAILLPALTGAMDAANRMADSERLSLIAVAINNYMSQNKGHYPTVYSNPSAAGEQWGPGFDTKTGVIADAMVPSGPGAVHGPYTCNLSCFYLLIRLGCVPQDVASSFICSAAPNREKLMVPNPAELWSFQNINQCSYSFQNQLGQNTSLKTCDPRMIVAADASPLRPGTVLPSDGKPAWEHNSPLFKFKGQNCLYADGHVAWTDTPYCGYGGNNIWLRSEIADHSAGLGKWTDDPDSTNNSTATIGDKYDSFLVP